MKFRHSKFKPLIGALLLAVIIVGIQSWDEGTFRPTPDLLWFVVPVALLLFGFKYGAYLFDKYVLDEAGLTVNKRFGRDIRVPFSDIKSVQLRNTDEVSKRMKGRVEIRYRPSEKLVIELGNLTMREEFVRRLQAAPWGKN